MTFDPVSPKTKKEGRMTLDELAELVHYDIGEDSTKDHVLQLIAMHRQVLKITEEAILLRAQLFCNYCDNPQCAKGCRGKPEQEDPYSRRWREELNEIKDSL